MIDHMGIGVKNYEAAKAFYEQTLESIGYSLLMESETESGSASCEFGKDAPLFWIADEYPATGLHFAFTVEERETVIAFHAAVLAAGGRDNGKPGVRPQYHANYYAAFARDLDGNNIEAVCHKPASAN